ncbi:hypothetical protein NE237_003247 [Protea cynaroides]|uniref:Uncharacterized protein n=1 Tax=Protea cynaroides TaxID=273540 RepID=A0A9Q0KGG9_9MAGN|nr:hypothetical protein NE237_003247 [Protea cynaroides]
MAEETIGSHKADRQRLRHSLQSAIQTRIPSVRSTVHPAGTRKRSTSSKTGRRQMPCIRRRPNSERPNITCRRSNHDGSSCGHPAGTLNHATILRPELDPNPWLVSIPDTLRYPFPLSRDLAPCADGHQKHYSSSLEL